MFGSSYFGQAYFGGSYFGPSSEALPDPVGATLDYTANRVRPHFTANSTRPHFTWSRAMAGPLILENRTKHPDDVVDIAIDMSPRLGYGVSLTGTPTASVVSGAGLTVGTPAVNTTPVEINGRMVGIGAAILTRVSAGTDGVAYRIKFSATTDESSAQTLAVVIDLDVSTTT